MGKLSITILRFFALLGLLLIGYACEEEGCQELTEVVVNARFYDPVTDEATIAPTLTLQGLGSDSLLLQQANSVSTFSLYLRQDTTATGFVFHFPQEVKDTVYIMHTNYHQVISLDCGCATFFTIDSMRWTRHQLDTLIIKQSQIGTDYEENIRFYL